jgi:hypothetical protein
MPKSSATVELFVTVGDKKIPVSVSPSGVFYDTKTRKFSAKTLRGLQKKMRQENQVTGSFPVEIEDTGELGTVINRKDLYNYIVRLEDGSSRTVYMYDLRRRTTKEERDKLEKMQEEVDKIDAASYEVECKQEEMVESLRVYKELNTLFKR